MTKTKKIVYWIATIWLSLGMVSTGIVQLMKGKEGPGAVESMTKLGYPLYFLTILAVWKLLGVVAVLAPGLPRVKKWAYAVFFFAMSGAIVSHLAIAGPAAEIFPALLLLVLTILSWAFRPADRRMMIVSK